MKRLRNAWWWLWNGFDRCDLALSRIEALERRNSDLSQIITGLATELNALRNQMADKPAPPPNTRVLRRWGDFKAAVERGEPIPGRPQPIPIERS